MQTSLYISCVTVDSRSRGLSLSRSLSLYLASQKRLTQDRSAWIAGRFSRLRERFGRLWRTPVDDGTCHTHSSAASTSSFDRGASARCLYGPALYNLFTSRQALRRTSPSSFPPQNGQICTVNSACQLENSLLILARQLRGNPPRL